MIAAVRCPRCGAAVELPVGLGPRLIHEESGASYITATTRAGKVDHACATTQAAGWVVVDE